MNPDHFRRHLRKIVSNTTKASAVFGTALLLNCGVEKQITTPPPSSTCPVEVSNCGGSIKGTLLKHVITTDDPSPLTFEQCRSLCQTAVLQKCPEADGGFRGGTVRVQEGAENCQEGKNEKDERTIDCKFSLEPGCQPAGRRPAGLEERESARRLPQTAEEEVGLFFADLAYLEDAAVTAFQYLVEELKAYHAPDQLLALATQAIEEEREHVVLMTTLAARYGATPERAKAAPFQLRSITEIAIENAREGCVRESFGSVMGFWQSVHAHDPAVRGIMGRIAYEESNHGALSWAIDEWLRPQLGADDRSRYEQAHKEAIAILQEEMKDEPSAAMRHYTGFPTPAESQHMFQQLVA